MYNLDFSNISKLISSLVKILKESKLPPSHQIEAELLIANCLNIKRKDLIFQFDLIFPKEQKKNFKFLYLKG